MKIENEELKEVEKLRGISQKVSPQEILEGEQAIVAIAERNAEKLKNTEEKIDGLEL